MRRLVLAILALALLVGACGDDDSNPIGGSDVEVLAAMSDYDLFAVIDLLDDGAYFDLLDFAGVDDPEQILANRDPSVLLYLSELLTAEQRLLVFGNGGTSSTSTAAPTTVPPTTIANGGPLTDLRLVDGGGLGGAGTLVVEVQPGDVSFLAYAVSGKSGDQVFITEVVSPSGLDVGEAVGIEYGDLTNYGEAAFLLPISDVIGLEPGSYRISFESTGLIVSSGAIVKSGDVSVEQAIDIVFWLATHESFDEAELEARFRQVGNEILNRHGIQVGTMSFVVPPPSVIDRFATIDLPESDPSDAALRALCKEMSTEIGDVRALNFAIVDELTGGGADYVIEGSASGLPGTIMLPGSGTSCVAAMAIPDPDDPSRDLLARANVIWHEAGHLLGLFHTTEEDGLFFDILADTPQCDVETYDSNGDGYIDFLECADADGGNFMFYDSDGTDMTPSQAWVLRHHPLLYTVGG